MASASMAPTPIPPASIRSHGQENWPSMSSRSMPSQLGQPRAVVRRLLAGRVSQPQMASVPPPLSQEPRRCDWVMEIAATINMPPGRFRSNLCLAMRRGMTSPSERLMLTIPDSISAGRASTSARWTMRSSSMTRLLGGSSPGCAFRSSRRRRPRTRTIRKSTSTTAIAASRSIPPSTTSMMALVALCGTPTSRVSGT